ncbi:MAG TPA: transcriptional repressor, partial [bacterium]|nr:transcriptional repressor [bacterium]
MHLIRQRSSEAETQERLRAFPDLCRRAGLKVTQQRLAVYGMLVSTDCHPTPEDVYSALRAKLPSLSLGTVYKTLDQFQRHGFLRKVSTEGQAARYDANVGPHHHLVCSGCGTIQDVQVQEDAMGQPGEALGAGQSGGFRITHTDIL